MMNTKKILSALLAAAMILLQLPVFAAGGDGTEQNPYKITTPEELQNINQNLSAHYRLENDLDLSGIDFEPLGNESDGAFTGTLDGNGFTVKNLTLEKEGNKYVGLVGCLEGTVKNIKLDNVTVNGQSARYVGSVAGFVEENALVENCETLSGSVTGSYVMVDFQLGGIVGYNKGTVRGCSNACKVEYMDSALNMYVGGVVGYSTSGTVESCHNIADVKSRYCVGGIIGYANNSMINTCSNNGCIYSYVPASVYMKCETDSLGWNPIYYNYSYIGGIVAVSNNSQILMCENIANISSITNKPNTSSSYAYGHSGGIVGTADNGIIKQCRNKGKIDSICEYLLYTGGIAGISSSNILYCNNEENTITTSEFSDGYIGGIVGSNNSFITSCTNKASILSSGRSAVVGGVVGANKKLITDCTNDADINVMSTIDICTGGIIGYHTNSTAGDIAKNCKNTGNIEIRNARYQIYVGGILGRATSDNSYRSLKNCMNWGNISSSIPTENDSMCVLGGITGGAAKLRNTDYNIYLSAYNCSNIGSITYTVKEPTIYDIAPNVANLYIKSSKINIKTNLTTAIPIELYGYDKDLKWTSADESIAVVDSKGNVTGVSAGETIITAETELGITTSTTVVVSAESTGADIVSLNKTSARLKPTETVQLTAEVTPAGATNPITWKSGDTSIATVDANGLVTAVKKGVTTITARIGSGRMFNCVINVVSDDVRVDVQSVTIHDSEITLAPNDAAALNAAVSPSNATDAELKYTSDNEDVATVNTNGIVTAKSAGVAVIRAESSNGCYDECVIRVVSADSASIVLNAEKSLSGDTAEVKASIVRNPGICAYKLNINYDTSALIPIKVTPNTDFKGTFTTNIEDENKTNLQIMWYSDEDTDLNAELFSITFEVSADAQIGDKYPVTAEDSAKDVYNTSGKHFAFYMQNTEIAVAEPLPGDIYEDGNVTAHDLTQLSRYVTHLEKLTNRQLVAADVNNDGAVNIKDVVRMSRYLVGWSGVELLSLPEEHSGTPNIAVGNSAVNDEGIAEIPVSIQNNSGIAGFVFELNYNRNEVEILGITPNEKLSENLKTNLGKTDDEGLFVSWYQPSNMTENGELFTIKARYLKDTVSPISIGYADICDKNEADVATDYTSGAILSDSFIITNEKLENNAYTADLYFDDTFKEQPAAAIAALYDESNVLVTLQSKDITVKSGKQSLSIPLKTTNADRTRLFIWDNLNSMVPLVKEK